MRIPLLGLAAAALFHAAGAGAAVTTVEGRVVDRATQQPIAGATVTLATYGFMPTPRTLVTSGQTGADGRYSLQFDTSHAFANALFVMAAATGHAARDHVDQSCTSLYYCNPSAAPLPSGQTLHVVDFSLDPAARIRGQLLDAATQQPPAYTTENRVSVQHVGPASLNHLYASVPVDAAGRFVIDNLPAGSYSLEATAMVADGPEAGLRYLRSVWPNRYCDNFQVSCESLRDTPLVLAAGEIRDGVDLALQRGSRIRVRLTSTSNGNGIPHQSSVLAVTGGPWAEMSGYLGTRDGYSLVGPLLPGPVHLFLRPIHPEAYAHLIYPDRPCIPSSCDITGATAIDVPADTLLTVADGQVAPRRTISGRVTDTTGAALPGVRVSTGGVSAGSYGIAWGFEAEASAVTDSDGRYRLEGYGGLYARVRTQHAGSGYVDKVWPNTSCDAANLFCDQSDAIYPPAIDVDTQPHLTAIDFVLERGADASIRGRVVDAATSASLPKQRVSVVPLTNPLLARPVVTDGDGRFAIIGLTPGDYYLFATPSVAVAQIPGWSYPGQSCIARFALWPLLCDMAAATPLHVDAGGTLENITFAVPLGPIFTGGFDP
jgi:hypothetical protein